MRVESGEWRVEQKVRTLPVFTLKSTTKVRTLLHCLNVLPRTKYIIIIINVYRYARASWAVLVLHAPERRRSCCHGHHRMGPPGVLVTSDERTVDVQYLISRVASHHITPAFLRTVVETLVTQEPLLKKTRYGTIRI